LEVCLKVVCLFLVLQVLRQEGKHCSTVSLANEKMLMKTAEIKYPIIAAIMHGNKGDETEFLAFRPLSKHGIT